MRFIIGSLVLLTLNVAIGASANNNDSSMLKFRNVETLNDGIKKYGGKRVQVTGDITKKIDSRSAILESGGFLNDEIMVIAGPGMNNRIAKLTRDEKVTVTGTIVLKPVNEVRREYDWDMPPQMESNFTRVKAFLVADEILSIKQ